MEHSCRLYKWESREENESHELDLNCEEEALVELKDVGSQLAVSFSGEGSILATGGEVSQYPLLVSYWHL
jgi:prolactin regulatory element-binding protein